MNSKLMILGRFGTPFGVQGWIKVNSFADPIEDILNFSPWYVEEGDGWTELKILASKLHATGVVVQLPSYTDRDQVRVYTNKKIAVDRSQLPKLPEGQYYWEELVGLEVINKENEILGIVDEMMATGANDVLVVKEGKKERLIPYIKSVVLTIDLAKKQIVVDWDSHF